MDVIYEYILWGKSRYKETIKALYSELRFLPKGKMTMKKINNKEYYYVQQSGKQTLIKKGEEERIRQYARKMFIESVLKVYQNNLMAIELAEHYFVPFSIETFYEKLPQKYKTIKKEAFFKVDQKSGDKIKQSENPYGREQLRHKTNSGVYVRSKSEVIIANILYEIGISFYYEKRLEISNKYRYPDFTLAHPITGESIYWEHFGLLGDNKYEEDMYSKLALYRDNGITQWNNLIVTYDEPGGRIDSAKIKRIIEVFM